MAFWTSGPIPPHPARPLLRQNTWPLATTPWTGFSPKGWSEIRLLVGAGAAGVFQHMGKLALNTGSVTEMSVEEKLRMLLGGLRVNGNVPDYAANKQDALIVKGMARRNAVAAVWQGVRLIPDEVTRAAQGEVKLTANMLYDFGILRTAGYTRHRFRTS